MTSAQNSAPNSASKSVAADAVDPRVEQSRRVIAEAALVEFATHGFDGMTIEGVAARAGVGKSTIYRHWTSRSELVESAIRSIAINEITIETADLDQPAAGLRPHLVRHLGELDAQLHREPWRSVLPAIIHAAERFPEVRDIQQRFGNEKRAALRAVLQRAIDHGQLDADLDLDILVRTLVAPLFHSRLMQNERLGQARIERLVEALVPQPLESSD